MIKRSKIRKPIASLPNSLDATTGVKMWLAMVKLPNLPDVADRTKVREAPLTDMNANSKEDQWRDRSAQWYFVFESRRR